eukprot:gene50761-67957_t
MARARCRGTERRSARVLNTAAGFPGGVLSQAPGWGGLPAVGKPALRSEHESGARWRWLRLALFAGTTVAVGFTADKATKAPAKPDDLVAQVGDGYRGIWYMNQPVKSEYVYKYSGGFATYPQQHVPIAIYVESQQKTFFVYGGSAGNVSVAGDELQHYISYYDHATGTVPRPVRFCTIRTGRSTISPTTI